MGEPVILRSVCTVHPAASSASSSSETSTKSLQLNPIDHWLNGVDYHKRILFFQSDDPLTDPSTLVGRLKVSLSETLVNYHPLAGRVRVRDEDGGLELVCSGEGAVFIEAMVDAQIDCIEGFQPSPFFSELVQTPGYHLVYPWKREYPLLFVQVTIFQKGGGVSIGVTYSHQVCDATSFWQFIKSWGEASRGIPISAALPHYQYGMLHPRTALGDPTDEYIDSMYGFYDPDEALDLSRKSRAPLESRLFPFTAEAVSDLKLSAGETSKYGRPFSTFEAVCAHIWKHAIAARELEGSTECKLFIAINLRGRVPPYPQNYFGNAAIFTAAITSVQGLKAATLTDAASLIHEAIAGFTEERILHLLGEISENMFDQKQKFTIRFNYGTNMFLRSSPRVRMYDTDFGLGRPAAVIFDIRQNSDGVLVLDGGREEGSLDVTLCLPPAAMDRLLRDQAFFPVKRSQTERGS